MYVYFALTMELLLLIIFTLKTFCPVMSQNSKEKRPLTGDVTKCSPRHRLEKSTSCPVFIRYALCLPMLMVVANQKNLSEL